MHSAAATDPIHQGQCPVCGQNNGCVMAAEVAQTPMGETRLPCWCTSTHFTPALLQKVPQAARGKVCICQACAQTAMTPA